MTSQSGGRFDRSFAIRMIRDFMIALLAIVVLELGARYALARYELVRHGGPGGNPARGGAPRRGRPGSRRVGASADRDCMRNSTYEDQRRPTWRHQPHRE